MTGPLIDRDALEMALYRSSGPVVDAVLNYLRDRLTPEALDPIEEWEPETEHMVGLDRYATGAGLHRRIFGEDK